MEENGVSLLKLEGAKAYLFYLTHIRRMVTMFYWTLLCTVIAALGFISLALSLALFLTSIVDLPLEVFVLEALFIVIPIGVFFILNSERAWITRSGISRLIQDVQSEASCDSRLDLRTIFNQ